MKDKGTKSMRTIGSLMLCRSLLKAGLVDRFRAVVFPVITGSTGQDRIYDGYPDVSLDMINSRMCDCVVSTGANIVDQDFFEALGFRHYIADEQLKSGMYDGMLREHGIDRIYDTLIDEEELRICDETVKRIADGLPPRPYSSRELIQEMGRHLEDGAAKADSIVQAAYQNGVPIFCPAFSDCSAGLGIVAHYHERRGQPT